jgi:hypothetical protein
MTAREGRQIALLLNFIFNAGGYTPRTLHDTCASLASNEKVPGWTAARVRDHYWPKGMQ